MSGEGEKNGCFCFCLFKEEYCYNVGSSQNDGWAILFVCFSYGQNIYLTITLLSEQFFCRRKHDISFWTNHFFRSIVFSFFPSIFKQIFYEFSVQKIRQIIWWLAKSQNHQHCAKLISVTLIMNAVDQNCYANTKIYYALKIYTLFIKGIPDSITPSYTLFRWHFFLPKINSWVPIETRATFMPCISWKRVYFRK